MVLECVVSAMTDQIRPRVKYVIGPDGSPLTINDLPPASTRRWVIRRKAEVVAAVEALGQRAIYRHADTTSEDDNEVIASAAISELGRLDICVAAAGVSHAAYESGNLAPDEELMKRYGEALFVIASHFETEGDRTLIGLLEGNADRNKMMNWGRIYNDAELLVDQNRCAEAIAVLAPIVDDTPLWAGTP